MYEFIRKKFEKKHKISTIIIIQIYAKRQKQNKVKMIIIQIITLKIHGLSNLKLKQSKMKTFKMKSFLSEENTNNKTSEVPCVDSGPLLNYFNKEEVKETLHVKKSKKMGTL